MTDTKFDVIVVGGGPGGMTAAQNLAHRHAGPATPRLIRRAARSGAITAGQAAVELAYRDPTYARLRAVFGAPVLPKPTLTPFAALANNIVEEPVSSRQDHRLHPRLSPLRSTLSPEEVVGISAC